MLRTEDRKRRLIHTISLLEPQKTASCRAPVVSNDDRLLALGGELICCCLFASVCFSRKLFKRYTLQLKKNICCYVLAGVAILQRDQ